MLEKRARADHRTRGCTIEIRNNRDDMGLDGPIEEEQKSIVAIHGI